MSEVLYDVLGRRRSPATAPSARGASTRQPSSKAETSSDLAIAFNGRPAQAAETVATVDGMTTSMPLCQQCGTPVSRPMQTFCSRDCAYLGRKRKARVPWQERFPKYLTPGAPDECWEWTGSRDQHGYGRLNSGGKTGRHIKAHRAAYELAHGPIPTGLVVCHRCDNPPCCNPAHLFLGTMRDNSRDMASKGRAAAQRGHSNHRETVSDDVVRTIRERAAQGDRLNELAGEFGVSDTTVSAFVYGQRRRRAGGPIKENRAA